jgi:hypothetical protein
MTESQQHSWPNIADEEEEFSLASWYCIAWKLSTIIWCHMKTRKKERNSLFISHAMHLSDDNFFCHLPFDAAKIYSRELLIIWNPYVLISKCAHKAAACWWWWCSFTFLIGKKFIGKKTFSSVYLFLNCCYHHLKDAKKHLIMNENIFCKSGIVLKYVNDNSWHNYYHFSATTYN